MTIPAQSLPLLEPTYLAVDVVNLLTGANFNNPIGTALSPVLTSLVNLGYTDVEYNATTGVYERTLDEADIPTAFGTLPADVDWAQVPGHLVNNLVTGIQKAIGDGLMSQNPVPSPIQTAARPPRAWATTLTSGGSGLDLSSLTDALTGLTQVAPNNVGTQSIAKTSFEPQGVTQTKVGTDTVELKSVVDEPVDGPVDDPKANVEAGADKLAAASDARKEVEKSVTEAGARAKASAEKARERTAKAVKDAQERVNKIAEDGRKEIKAAAEGIQKGAEKAVNDVKDNVKKAGDSVKPAKKTEKKDTKDAA